MRARLHETATAPVPWTASLLWTQMGTEPNGHGMPSTEMMLSTATVTTSSRVNGLIECNVTHFHGAVAVHGKGFVPLLCKRTLTTVYAIPPSTWLETLLLPSIISE